MKLARELGLGFRLLGDPDLHVASAYGVAMQGQDIAVPSVFVVTKDRRVAWSQVGENVTDRATNEDILARVRAASAPAKP